jgi:protein-tyrosine phosphatase
MRDIHTHILPGVDDGAKDEAESFAMLDAAADAGVTEMVCTPHCREPYFNYDAMVAAYRAFRAAAQKRHPQIAISLGFEVNLLTLRKIGFQWAEKLGFEKPRPAHGLGPAYGLGPSRGLGPAYGLGPSRGLELGGTVHEFLLELPVDAESNDYPRIERAIFALQGMGYEVIIAHPERYLAIREDMGLARRLVDMGCRLQASGDFLTGGRLKGSRRPAKKMLKAGLYSYIASDAHNVEHYRVFAKAWRKYSKYLRAE